LQRKESPTNARNAAVQLHDFGCCSPAVTYGPAIETQPNFDGTISAARSNLAVVQDALAVKVRVALAGVNYPDRPAKVIVANQRSTIVAYWRVPWCAAFLQSKKSCIAFK
jgi:hypothetical protein